MRITSFILFNLISTLCLAQANIMGQVLLSKDSRGLTISNSHKSNQEFIYSIKSSKNKKGKLVVDSIIVPVKVIKNHELISIQTTDKNGKFELENLPFGDYQIQVDINNYLSVDTIISLSEKNTKTNIILDDRKLWKYVDSTQLAKYPYNADIAKADLENGIVKVLRSGLSKTPYDQLNLITSKYGFKYEGVGGCIVGGYQQQAMDNYNEIVFDYLDKINPSGWRDRLKVDLQNANRNR